MCVVRVCLCMCVRVYYVLGYHIHFHFTVINGEKAANSAPVFADKRERTLDLLLKHIEENYNSTKVHS